MAEPYMQATHRKFHSPASGKDYEFELRFSQIPASDEGVQEFEFLEKMPDGSYIPIMATGYDILITNDLADLVGIADSESAEQGEIAFQIFNVKRERPGYLLMPDVFCYETYDNPDINNPKLAKYFAERMEDAPHIIGVLYEMLAARFKREVARFRNIRHDVPLYVAFLVGQKSTFPIENTFVPAIRKDVPSLTVKYCGKGSLCCSGCTLVYYKLVP